MWKTDSKSTKEKLVGSGPIVFNSIDLQYIKFVLENLSDPDNAWDPTDWDTIDEAHPNYWHDFCSRIRGQSPYEAMEFKDGCFCVKDPANGPVDMNNRIGVIEFTSTLLDDLVQELARTGPDGIIPVQGFKA